MMDIKWKVLYRFAAAAVVSAALTGCAGRPEPVSRSTFLFNTFVTITLYDAEDQKILDGCMELCEKYEHLFSKTMPDSEVYRMNHRGKGENAVEVSPETAKLVKQGLHYSSLSDGAFDITIEPLSSLWDFTAENPVIPPDRQIREAAERVDYRNVSVDGNKIIFQSPDTAIDLGGIAKGYIADQLKSYLKKQGVNSAVINLGGNILCVGEKPDGGPFRIGLQKPFARHSETVASLDIRDRSVVSSGVYERHFEVNGVNYHHILNPDTGYPYENGLTAVTILSAQSVDGDGLSTACFSLGLEKGMELADALDGVYAVFIMEDGSMRYSSGAEDFISGSNE